MVFALAQRRRTALILTLSGLLWVLVWSLPETSLYLGGKLETRYHYQLSETLPKADVIVVLGGNIQGNRANWFEPYNRATATDRVDRAAELYFAGRAPKIILSGGALEGRVSDARAMARTLRQKGVPESAVILENEARNTYENALLTQSLLTSMGGDVRPAHATRHGGLQRTGCAGHSRRPGTANRRTRRLHTGHVDSTYAQSRSQPVHHQGISGAVRLLVKRLALSGRRHLA